MANLNKDLSITVYPNPLSGEYLTVADAMRQVLDIVDALEGAEAAERGQRQIVWRLTKAHTNSPPFTIVAEPFPIQPELSIGLEAKRVLSGFTDVVRSLLTGTVQADEVEDFAKPLRRALERNLNGVGKTAIDVKDGAEPISIVPQNAKLAVAALDRLGFEEEAAKIDWSRTEYGAVEGTIGGITTWNEKPALMIVERLSGTKFTAVLDPELARQIGDEHTWVEAWDGRRVLVSGALYFNPHSVLKRADISEVRPLNWTDVPLAELRKLDLLDGRSVREHLALIRGEDG